MYQNEVDRRRCVAIGGFFQTGEQGHNRLVQSHEICHAHITGVREIARSTVSTTRYVNERVHVLEDILNAGINKSDILFLLKRGGF